MRLAQQLRILVAIVGAGVLLSGCGSDEERPTTSSLEVESKSADATPTASSDTADATPTTSSDTADATPTTSSDTADATPTTSSDTADATPTTSSDTADATPTASSDTASRLDGTWRTGAITPREVDETLRRYGLGKWKGRFRSVTPVRSTTTLILKIKNGEWDLYGQAAGKWAQREEIDYDAEYDVKGDKVQKIHATGVTTYGWSVNDDDTLTFEWISTTEPPYEGIPDEVFSRVLYMTQPFKRQT